MQTYRVTTFLTLRGRSLIIELPDPVYGEWIVYENNEYTFHISIFNRGSASDKRIEDLITIFKVSIESIIQRINKDHNRKLKLLGRPAVGIELQSVIKELDLPSLPLEWLSFSPPLNPS